MGTSRDLDEQLDKYLADAHSIEEQALAQMRTAPDIAGDRGVADAFIQHREETERHEQLVRERLSARGAKPSRFKDLVMSIGGKGFIRSRAASPTRPASSRSTPTPTRRSSRAPTRCSSASR